MRVRFRILSVLAVLLPLCSPQVSRDCFALRRQQDPKVLREREGLSLKLSARLLPDTISPRGGHVVTRISEAGARGDWQEAQRWYSTYDGAEIQVFNAIMHAASQCDQYKQGADIYRRLCSLDINKTAPSFTAALKIHSRLVRSMLCVKFGRML